MTEPIAKRADQLVVGDRIPDEYLPMRFNKGPGEVVYVANELGYELGGGDAHTFFAYRYPNGRHDSTTVRSDGYLEVYPADPTGQLYSRVDDGEQPQPVAGRTPAHYGVVDAAGLVEIGDPGADRELPCGVDLPHGPHALESVSGTCPGVGDPPEGFVPAGAPSYSGREYFEDGRSNAECSEEELEGR